MQSLGNHTTTVDNTTASVTGYRVEGMTSPAFHVSMWLLLSSGIVGNILVLLWRCLRKRSRLRLLSLLIVSLAFADLLWCCHYLLQEVMVVYPIFKAGRNESLSFTGGDERLCFSSAFLGYASCNASMLTVVAIALFNYMTLRGYRHRNRFIAVFVSLAWVASLAVAASALHDFTKNIDKFRSIRSTFVLRFNNDAFSLVVMVGCRAPIREMLIRYPMIVSSINAISSLVCTVVYICVWRKIRNKECNSSYMNQELRHLQIRLTIIAALSLLCWWPSCILYWFSFIRNKTVYNGSLSPHSIEPAIVFSIVASAANPLIYTIAAKPFAGMTARCCKSLCYHCNEESRMQLYFPSQRSIQRRSCSCYCCCSTVCCCGFWFQMLESDNDLLELGSPLLGASEKTEETETFPETKN